MHMLDHKEGVAHERTFSSWERKTAAELPPLPDAFLEATGGQAVMPITGLGWSLQAYEAIVIFRETNACSAVTCLHHNRDNVKHSTFIRLKALYREAVSRREHCAPRVPNDAPDSPYRSEGPCCCMYPCVDRFATKRLRGLRQGENVSWTPLLVTSIHPRPVPMGV